MMKNLLFTVALMYFLLKGGLSQTTSTTTAGSTTSSTTNKITGSSGTESTTSTGSTESSPDAESQSTESASTQSTESTEGGSTGGGSTEGGSTGGGSTEGGSTEGGSDEGGSSEGGSTEGGSTGGASTEGGSTVGDSTEGGLTTGESHSTGSPNAGSTMSSKCWTNKYVDKHCYCFMDECLEKTRMKLTAANSDNNCGSEMEDDIQGLPASSAEQNMSTTMSLDQILAIKFDISSTTSTSRPEGGNGSGGAGGWYSGPPLDEDGLPLFMSKKFPVPPCGVLFNEDEEKLCNCRDELPEVVQVDLLLDLDWIVLYGDSRTSAHYFLKKSLGKEWRKVVVNSNIPISTGRPKNEAKEVVEMEVHSFRLGERGYTSVKININITESHTKNDEYIIKMLEARLNESLPALEYKFKPPILGARRLIPEMKLQEETTTVVAVKENKPEDLTSRILIGIAGFAITFGVIFICIMVCRCKAWC